MNGGLPPDRKDDFDGEFRRGAADGGPAGADSEEGTENPLYDCYSLLHDLVYILAAITIVFVFFVRLVGVDGPSMMPTLQDGDYVALLSNLFMGDLEQGDVIVARKESLKRRADRQARHRHGGPDRGYPL